MNPLSGFSVCSVPPWLTSFVVLAASTSLYGWSLGMWSGAGIVMQFNSSGQVGGYLPMTLIRWAWMAAILLCVAFIQTGCQYHEVVPYPEQEMAISEIVPFGTSREEVAARLKEAGITYSPSPGPTPGVFYCESWQMESGESFLLYCELLFDEEGLLQEIRMSPNNY